jgi:hypothetical protein
MPDSLTQLEAQRTELFRQIAEVGDFRRGSITTTSGKCGKPSCHCARSKRSRPWTKLPPHPRGSRQNHHPDL